VRAVPGCVDAVPAGPAGARDGPEQPRRLGPGRRHHVTNDLDRAGHDSDHSDEEHPDNDVDDEDHPDNDVHDKDHPDNDDDEARDRAQAAA